MDCVNLGKDYFLIRFHSPDDYDNVLKGGPWFVGEHFLAIKPWEPYFRASGDNLTSVAVWVRFPELPIEFFDLEVPKEIGSAVGPVLRIDSYTANGSRGSYARLCIQVDIDRPLIKSIRIGRMVQQVLYEGISSLCFCCVRLGHKQENFWYQIKQQERHSSSPSESLGQEKVEEKVEEKALDQNYGPWMLVIRKNNLVRNGRAKSNFKESQDKEVTTKGKMVFRGINSEDKEVDVMVKSPKADFPHSKQSQSRVRLDVFHQSAAVEEQYLMDSRQVASGSGIEIMSFQSEGVRSNFAPSTNNKSKKNLGIKGSKSLKRQHPTSNPKTPSHHLSLTSEYGSHFSGKELSTSDWVGDLASRKASKSVRRVHSLDQGRTNEIVGLVRQGTGKSVEIFFPDHSYLYQNGVSSTRPSCMGSDPQPLLDFHHRHTGVVLGGDGGIEQAEKAICDSPLQRIRVENPGKEVGGFQENGNIPHGESPSAKASADSSPSEDM